jgi:hypothetical protein
MAVSGDQWPIFLYHGYNFDPEDPWNGLFRSSILVLVGLRIVSLAMLTTVSGRATNTSLHLPARSIRSLKLHVPATPAFME